MFFAATVATVAGQTPAAGTADPPSPGPVAASDLNLIALPTTQPLKRHGTYFRLTHRFTRDLGFGTFGDLADDLFGLDAGSIVGFEFRFAPAANVQVAAHRSNYFKDIQLAGRYDAFRQGPSSPIEMSFIGSIEGDNNLQEHHQPAVGAVLSRDLGRRVTFYASPFLVWNTPTEATGHEGHDHEHGFAQAPPEEAHDEYTVFAGIGARLRLRPAVSIVVEYSPRVAGYAPDRGAWGVGLETSTRGHMFQVNVTNSFGTTFGQIARGGARRNSYLGFNLARRF
jgi:hypothetical protein